MNKSRRRFFGVLGGAAAACAGWGSVASTARAQKSAQALSMTELRDGLVQVSGAGGNVVVLPSSEGLVLVDSGAPARAAELAAFIGERFRGAPVEVLFNTHWHLDHTGGNEPLAAGRAAVVSHENTRLWMSTTFYVDWEERRYRPREPGALPNKTFFSHEPQPIEIDFAGEQIVYAHLPQAHTDGDIYVRFPERNVIVAGGVITAGSYPAPDYITGGWIGGLNDATRALIEMADEDTLIVPAEGPVRRRADLEAQLEMAETVRERIEAMAIEGKGIDEMIDARITEDFDERWGNNGALFISNLYHGMWWNRLRGTVA